MEHRGYSTDLAYIHDSGFGDIARAATDNIINILRANNLKECKIVELGCGSGISAGILLSAGFEVYGIDLSESMIKLAQSKYPQGTFVLDSLWDTEIPECHVVLSIGECLNYEFDGPIKLGKIEDLFQRVYSALQPKGIFIFDILCQGHPNSNGCTKNFTEAEDWFVAVERTETYNRIKRRIISFRAHGTSYQRTLETHYATKYNIQETTHTLEDVGFRVEVQAAYGERSFGVNHRVFIARKE